MKFTYYIRLLTQYEIQADSFDEALLKAVAHAMPSNKDGFKYHYVGKNEKRYHLDADTMKLTEVDTFGKEVNNFGKIKSLKIIDKTES